MKSGIEIITDERLRQVNDEGFTLKSDIYYIDERLAYAAACYAIPQNGRNIYAGVSGTSNIIRALWPKSWSFRWWKPTPDNRIKELAKAGALIAAEIDRLNNYKYPTNDSDIL